MSNEKWLEGISGLEDIGNPDLDRTLMNIWSRHVNLAAKTERIIPDWHPDSELELKTGQLGDELMVRTKDKRIMVPSIGFYWDGAFVLYPEYVETEENNFIQLEASQKRFEAIEKFNDSEGKLRNDYEHPDIRSLHRLHQDFFDETMCLDNILNMHNFIKDKEYDLFPDEATKAAVYLKKGILMPEHITYTEIGVRVIGAYHLVNDVKNRRSGIEFIPIAKREVEDGEITDWRQDEDREFVPSYLFDDFVELIEPVIELDNRTDLNGTFTTTLLTIGVSPTGANELVK